jgi:hypothetical protein
LGQVILMLCIVILIAVLVDFRRLRRSGTVKEWFVYLFMFWSGMILLFLYGCQIAIPNIPVGNIT